MKRQREESAEAPPAKVQKHKSYYEEGETFDVRLTNFKSLIQHLNSPDDRVLSKGIRAFMDSIELKPNDVPERVPSSLPPATLANYLEASPSCVEIRKIWKHIADETEEDKIHGEILGLITAMFENSTENQINQGLMNLFAKRILSDFNQVIAKNLGATNLLLPRETLRLLGALVRSDATVAHEVFNSFPFSSATFLRLANKRHKAVSAEHRGTNIFVDVRTWFVRLALAFLQCPSNALIRDVLQEQFLRLVFIGKGMHMAIVDDNPKLANEILSVFLAHVIQNDKVLPKFKKEFFDIHVLGQLANLYQSPRPEIVPQLHGFLLALFTPPHGVLEEDGNNIKYLQFLIRLVPQRGLNQQELIFTVLQKSNWATVSEYINLFCNKAHIHPHPGIGPVTSLNFLWKVLQLPQIRQHQISQPRADFSDEDSIRRFIPVAILPPHPTRSEYNVAFGHGGFVALQVLKVLKVVLQNLIHYFSGLQISTTLLKSYAQTCLPDITRLVDLLFNPKTGPELFKLGLDCFSLFVQCFYEAGRAQKTGKMLSQLVLGLDKVPKAHLQQYSVLSVLGSHLGKMNASVWTEREKGGISPLHVVLKIAKTSPYKEIKDLSTNILQQFFTAACFFTSPIESQCWIQNMDQNSLGFLESVLAGLGKKGTIVEEPPKAKEGTEVNFGGVSNNRDYSAFLWSAINLIKKTPEKAGEITPYMASVLFDLVGLLSFGWVPVLETLNVIEKEAPAGFKPLATLGAFMKYVLGFEKKFSLRQGICELIQHAQSPNQLFSSVKNQILGVQNSTESQFELTPFLMFLMSWVIEDIQISKPVKTTCITNLFRLAIISLSESSSRASALHTILSSPVCTKYWITDLSWESVTISSYLCNFLVDYLSTGAQEEQLKSKANTTPLSFLSSLLARVHQLNKKSIDSESLQLLNHLQYYISQLRPFLSPVDHSWCVKEQLQLLQSPQHEKLLLKPFWGYESEHSFPCLKFKKINPNVTTIVVSDWTPEATIDASNFSNLLSIIFKPTQTQLAVTDRKSVV